MVNNNLLLQRNLEGKFTQLSNRPDHAMLSIHEEGSTL
jgi:hypothetical protein